MKITPIKYAIHKENESPIFGEHNTYIYISDEGAGTFLCISQENLSTNDSGAINLDWNEFDFLVKSIKKLRKIHEYPVKVHPILL